jgi:GNAT superfamily N-acetyltransferase
MNIQVRRVDYKDVEAMRELYRHEAHCQIIHDSALRRGMADPYLIVVNDIPSGYGAVWNHRFAAGRLMEFYTVPNVRSKSQALVRELLIVSQATSMEAQTNMPLMLTMLFDCAKNITTESILFEDASTTHLTCPDGVFRRATPEDAAAISPDQQEPAGDWVIEAQGSVVANGGFLCHYNPPYGDIYMEVSEPARRQGFGSYLVQELKRVCYEAGKKPAARCNPTNTASRRTLQKAGFLPCGRLLIGEVVPMA